MILGICLVERLGSEMSLQEFPDARINAPLHEILVRAEHIDYPDPDVLPGDVFEFVDRMLWDGRYPRRAMPRDAVVGAAVHFFMNTTLTDGLVGFVDATGMDPAVCDDVREGLRRLGFDDLAAIFAGLEDFVARTDQEQYDDGSWSSDPVFEELDARLNPSIPFDEYYGRLAAWMREWPYLRGVPGAQFQATLAALVEKNRPAPEIA
jgi:hypothetical protein